MRQYLPPEVMINILSRLPVGSIIGFKFVCKLWLDLIDTGEIGKAHLCNSKQIPGLAFFEDCSRQYRFYKYVDELEHDLSLALKFCMPTHLRHVNIRDCSVNGLLLFSDRRILPRYYFICNPLTRDYIKLPSSSHEQHYEEGIGLGLGFGVSKMSGEYKIVNICETKCEVYTLGTGSWRSVAPCSYRHTTTAMFLNGNLHWLLRDSYSSNTTVNEISCFDLETELFTIFSLPPLLCGGYSAISALEECLAFCHNEGRGLVIWLMNEYGNDKSWTMSFIINNQSGVLYSEVVTPIKIFKDGYILIARPLYSRLLYYYNNTFSTIELSKMPFLDGLGCGRTRAVRYTPSFVSLKTFSRENVSSF